MLREREHGFNYSTLFQKNVIHHFEDGRLMARLDLEHDRCTIALETVMTQTSCTQLFNVIRQIKTATLSQKQSVNGDSGAVVQSSAGSHPQKLTLIKAELTEISGFTAQRYDLVYQGNVVKSVWASSKLRALIDPEINASYIERLRDVWREIRSGDDLLASDIARLIGRISETQEIMRWARPSSYALDYGDEFQVDREVIDVEVDDYIVDDFQFPSDLRQIGASELIHRYQQSDSNLLFQ